jgi:hypothetical protein
MFLPKIPLTSNGLRRVTSLKTEPFISYDNLKSYIIYFNQTIDVQTLAIILYITIHKKPYVCGVLNFRFNSRRREYKT